MRTKPASRKWANLIMGLLCLHFLVLLTHSAAHFYHQVYPDTLGYLIIVFGYYLLPAVGLYKLYHRARRGLFYVLAGISVAFLHGFIYHFVLDTPDYVCYFGAHITGLWFTLTAYGLAIADAGIVVFTLMGLAARPDSQFSRQAEKVVRR